MPSDQLVSRPCSRMGKRKSQSVAGASSSSAGAAENLEQPTRGMPSSSASDVAGAIAEAWEEVKEDPEGCINYGTHLCRVDLEQI